MENTNEQRSQRDRSAAKLTSSCTVYVESRSRATIRNRDTVAITTLNNSSLPVLSKNISTGPPSLLHFLHRYSTPLTPFFSSYSCFSTIATHLRSFQEKWENWYVFTAKSFKVEKERGKEEIIKEKVVDRDDRIWTKRTKVDEKSVRCRKTFFSSAFVSRQATRQVVPFFPFSARVTRNARGS